MRIIKYLLLFLICFVVSMYLLNTYKRNKKATNKELIKEKYDQKTLSRISVPLLIDRGKIKESFIEGTFYVKNVGDFDLSELKVSGDCSCTDIKFKDKKLKKGGISIVYYKIDLKDDKGWFNKVIKLEGSFFPPIIPVRIEGYKLP